MTRARSFLVVAAVTRVPTLISVLLLVLVLSLTLAVTLALTGCAPAERSPLVARGDGLVDCLPATDNSPGVITVPIENAGPDPIVLSGTSLHSMTGSRLVASWVLPAGDGVQREAAGDAGDDATGEAAGNDAGITYFGRTAPSLSPAWSARTPALGATIPADDTATLAFEVGREVSGPTSTLVGATISYSGSASGSVLTRSSLYFGFRTIPGECIAPD
ncbi:hypothetical protein B0I08_107183 [Glaciihabitans tibetensis]|uniref:Uncharacterized protein n=1 Tax=Glaciihabitans tibetensis TaxID=1266600 RepID=A0A2T0VB48_9MICO|nr:hypothetical protein [Glaciihabitans tibetensis]PRY67287.1 hypothetical protein B0I08_107183 [Glaciihabitans tibetensis]